MFKLIGFISGYYFFGLFGALFGLLVGALIDRMSRPRQKIADGLQKPRSEKRHVVPDDSGKTATALTWEKSLVAGTMATHPGVYCLRSNDVEERMKTELTLDRHCGK